MFCFHLWFPTYKTEWSSKSPNVHPHPNAPIQIPSFNALLVYIPSTLLSHSPPPFSLALQQGFCFFHTFLDFGFTKAKLSDLLNNTIRPWPCAQLEYCSAAHTSSMLFLPCSQPASDNVSASHFSYQELCHAFLLLIYLKSLWNHKLSPFSLQLLLCGISGRGEKWTRLSHPHPLSTKISSFLLSTTIWCPCCIQNTTPNFCFFLNNYLQITITSLVFNITQYYVMLCTISKYPLACISMFLLLLLSQWQLFIIIHLSFKTQFTCHHAFGLSNPMSEIIAS